MKFCQALRSLAAACLAGSVACPPAQALVSLDDSRDHIYVTGRLGVSRNSNIAANHLSGADTVTESGVSGAPKDTLNSSTFRFGGAVSR